MQIVINNCHGGFSLSEDQVALLGVENEYDEPDGIRTDPRLIESVLKGDDGGRHADLEVATIPDGYFYKIAEYDGAETIYFSASEIYEVWGEQ